MQRRALTGPAPAQGFNLGAAGFAAPGGQALGYGLLGAACHAPPSHYVAYIFQNGIFFFVNDLEVCAVGAHLGDVKAHMRKRRFTPRLLAYARGL